MAATAGYLGKCMANTPSATIAEMGTWSVSGMDIEMLEDTAFEDDFKSYKPGLGDGGTVTFSGNYDATDTTGQDYLIECWETKAAVTAPLFYYSADGYYGLSSGAEAFITSIELGVDINGLGTISFTMKISGGYLEKQ